MNTVAKRQYPVYDPVHLIGTVLHRDDDGSFVIECDGHHGALDWLPAAYCCRNRAITY